MIKNRLYQNYNLPTDVAVFSDIHGNYAAFESCVEYALKRKIDTFIFLGDYLGEFPYPQKTMEMLYGLRDKYNCFFVRGNKEDYWINEKNNGNSPWGNSSTGALQYCYSHLVQKDFDFFSSLPICTEIRLGRLQALLACHGSPNKNNEKMLPNHDGTKRIIEECSQKHILCGHTHIQQLIGYNGKMVYNPGAVGVPLHSEGKAQFMILHSDDTEWRHEFIDVDYDKDLMIREIKNSGLMELAPYWSQVTIHLIRTGEISHGTVLAKAMGYCKAERGACAWYDVPDQYWARAVRELTD